MAYTALAQTPAKLGGKDGVNPFAAAEAPDVVNGNTFAHTAKRCLLIRNNHDAKYISCQPKIQRTIKEGTDDITIADPAATQIPFGQTRFMGPFSAANFRKTDDGKVYFDWALEGGGDIVAADVDVAVIDLP